MKLPEQYQGIVWMETQRPMDENAKRSFRTKGIFTEFTYWNYDKVPSNNDALKQALEWNDYANVVSSESAQHRSVGLHSLFNFHICSFISRLHWKSSRRTQRTPKRPMKIELLFIFMFIIFHLLNHY